MELFDPSNPYEKAFMITWAILFAGMLVKEHFAERPMPFEKGIILMAVAVCGILILNAAT